MISYRLPVPCAARRLALTVRGTALVTLLATASFMAGCHSTFVQATIVNHSGAPLRLVEMDYPSASFGTTNLNKDAEFHYRFKIQGSGSAKLDFEDAEGKAHHSVGPELDEGQEGGLTITIGEAGKVIWAPVLTAGR
jgi:hypothetical protein